MAQEMKSALVTQDGDGTIRMMPLHQSDGSAAAEFHRAIAESVAGMSQQMVEIKRALAPIATKLESNGVIMERMCAAIENGVHVGNQSYGGGGSGKSSKGRGMVAAIARMNICGCCCMVTTISVLATLVWLTFIFVTALKQKYA